MAQPKNNQKSTCLSCGQPIIYKLAYSPEGAPEEDAWFRNNRWWHTDVDPYYRECKTNEADTAVFARTMALPDDLCLFHTNEGDTCYRRITMPELRACGVHAPKAIEEKNHREHVEEAHELRRMEKEWASQVLNTLREVYGFTDVHINYANKIIVDPHEFLALAEKHLTPIDDEEDEDDWEEIFGEDEDESDS